MPTTPACRPHRGPDAPHRFDLVSGWCIYGCGLRDDGRHQTFGGQVIDPGPEYTAEQLADLAARTAAKTHQETTHDAQLW